MDDFGYNNDKDAKQTWEKNDHTGEVVERIETAAMPTLTVKGCQHLKTTRKTADDFDGYDEVSCSDCPLGWIVKKSS